MKLEAAPPKNSELLCCAQPPFPARAIHRPPHTAAAMKADGRTGEAGASLLAGDTFTPLGKGGEGSKEGAKSSSASSRAKWQLGIAMVFCFVFMIGEVVGGYLAGSLAIMTE